MEATETAVEMVRLGIHVPGLLASNLYQDRERGYSCREAVNRLLSFSRKCTAVCPECGIESWMGFPSVADAKELYRLAGQMAFRNFRNKFERRYTEYRFTCPHCGKEKGRLSLIA